MQYIYNTGNNKKNATSFDSFIKLKILNEILLFSNLIEKQRVLKVLYSNIRQYLEIYLHKIKFDAIL